MGKKPDFTQVAFRVAQQATRQAVPTETVFLVSPKTAAGRKGGLKGGKARASKLSPEERSATARRAALARWEKHQRK